MDNLAYGYSLYYMKENIDKFVSAGLEWSGNSIKQFYSPKYHFKVKKTNNRIAYVQKYTTWINSLVAVLIDNDCTSSTTTALY